MEITLNHTLVHSIDHIESAKWYEKIFGFKFIKEWGYFAVVAVNSHFTMDFINKKSKITRQHYAFKVSEQQFDEILERIKNNKVDFCSYPDLLEKGKYDFKVNHDYGGRGVYFPDPSGHALEILTTNYDLESDFFATTNN